MGIFSGFVMYLAYAVSHKAWLNYYLIGIVLFVAFFIPFYSKFSNKIDEKLSFLTARVTPGRIGRFAAQYLFNIGIFFLFVYGNVFKVANISSIGGIFGISFVTTLASQGAQYIALILANREIGNANRNVLIALSLNIIITALSTLGIAYIKSIFVILGIGLGIFVFFAGILSDIRSIIYPRRGIGVFFGTFNPLHKTHIQLMKDLLSKRNLSKIYIHSTVVPKLHREALRKGEITIDHYENGMIVYKKTNKADTHVNYFPTGNKFYEYETRKNIISISIDDAGLNQKVIVLDLPDIYEKNGFYGIISKIKKLNPGKSIHGIHGSDLGGMWVRGIYDESGWIYPFSIKRKNNVSATAIRNGAIGMTSPVIQNVIQMFKNNQKEIFINNYNLTISGNILKFSKDYSSDPIDAFDPKKVKIKIVQNQEELLQAFLIRAIVYMHEQCCPYNEEFDLNDYTATQVIGYYEKEPIMTARIRYFENTAKLERLAVRIEYRNKGIGDMLLAFLLKFCRNKGYKKFYLHSQKERKVFYKNRGFKKFRNDFHFSGYDYCEMIRIDKIDSSENLIFKNSSMHSVRPEGSWDIPGPLEHDFNNKNYTERLNTQA